MPASVKIIGNDAAVIKHLAEVPSRIDDALRAGLMRGLQYAQAVAGTRFLTGPRPEKLGVRTGRLRSSVTQEITETTAGTESAFSGRIGTNVQYAAFHEFGFHGVESVRAHTRVVATLDVTGNAIDERRQIRDRQGNFIGYRESRSVAASRAGSKTAFTFTENVRAHTRKVDYAGRPFIRPALTLALPVIEREVNKQLAQINNP